jgi:hypothetical protein
MEDFLIRWWQEIVGRGSGPLKMRLIMQPLMATILAVRAGLKDAREGRPPYFWSIWTHPHHRPEMIRSGWKDIGKVFILAMILDFIYQLIVLRTFHPIQTLVVASTLALVPYLCIRGPVNRIKRGSQGDSAAPRRRAG